jgi:hypothetical protein
MKILAIASILFSLNFCQPSQSTHKTYPVDGYWIVTDVVDTVLAQKKYVTLTKVTSQKWGRSTL